MIAPIREIRYALRGIRNQMGMNALILLSLAVGIGVNAAVFSLVDGIFLRPFDIENPDNLVRLGNNPANGRGSSISFVDYQDIRSQSSVFSGLAAESRRRSDPGTMVDYGVSPGDPPTLAASALAVTAIALISIQIPVWRATRVDPARALRNQ